MKLISLLAFIVTCLLAFPTMAADVEAGKAKSALCENCHGKNGKASVPLYPHLAGQNAQYLEKTLRDYRDGKRKDPAMEGFAKILTDADIENLSAYYASLPAGG